ncbi:MAG: 3'(2'),5'-bisphosphate nucleotidase CysQ [Flavobacteriales bacterium]
MKTEYLNIAIVAALDAGSRIMEIYQSEDFDVQLKSDDSPLTKADLASHNIIAEHLKKTPFPLLSEEGKDIDYVTRKTWDKLWIVDPIDGTKEFIKRNGEFTVNIALIEKQEPILGVIYAPVLKELYFSMKGKGAFKVKADIDTKDIEELFTTAQKLPIERKDSTYTIVASRSHMSEETEQFIDDMRAKHGEVQLISKGSSLKLCMVAEGSANTYPRYAPTMEWDTAAGQAICSEAGFEVIDYETKSVMIYNRKILRNAWFLVK